jgi:hypothetical protein
MADESMQDATVEVPEAPEVSTPPEPAEFDAAEPVEPSAQEPTEAVTREDAGVDETPLPTAPAPLAPSIPEAPFRGVSQTPFLLYLALWVVFIVASATLLFESARTTGVLYSDRYVYAVYAAAALALLGPVLALIVWLVTRARRTKDGRRGLFAASMLAGAGVTFVGSVLWLVLLFVLDLYQAGVFS